jgi:hypothetical protein
VATGKEKDIADEGILLITLADLAVVVVKKTLTRPKDSHRTAHMGLIAVDIVLTVLGKMSQKHRPGRPGDETAASLAKALEVLARPDGRQKNKPSMNDAKLSVI